MIRFASEYDLIVVAVMIVFEYDMTVQLKAVVLITR